MKKRIDILLVEKNIFNSREKAKTNIMAGNVLVDHIVVDKPGTMVDENSDLRLKEQLSRYVSRGGLKLEKALDCFDIDLSGKVCMDVGASTGGFTDCMLQTGALKVYSIDVGYGQLDWKLRSDDRVICMERTNIRHFDTKKIEEKIDFISVDVSFISLKLVLPVIETLIHKESDIVLLIKPQFEAGKQEVSKHSGVIKDPKIHERVVSEILDFCVILGFTPRHLSFSPIKGPKGNIEFLFHIQKTSTGDKADIDVKETVRKAHEELSLC